jgi:hypothetical protein
MNGRTEPTSYFQELAQSSSAALEQALRVGVLPEETSLAGWEWNGQNTGRIPRLLGIQKFIKGFFCETEGLEGYNVVAQQNGPENPWVEKPAALTKRRFGFYRVRPALEEPRDRRYPNALMLNYGASPRNPRCQCDPGAARLPGAARSSTTRMCFWGRPTWLWGRCGCRPTISCWRGAARRLASSPQPPINRAASPLPAFLAQLRSGIGGCG